MFYRRAFGCELTINEGLIPETLKKNVTKTWATPCLVVLVPEDVVWADLWPLPPFAHKGGGAVIAIMQTDTTAALTAPFVDTLPQAILDIVSAESNGTIATSYRRYVMTAVFSMVRHVTEKLQLHAATCEWPSKSW